VIEDVFSSPKFTIKIVQVLTKYLKQNGVRRGVYLKITASNGAIA